MVLWNHNQPIVGQFEAVFDGPSRISFSGQVQLAGSTTGIEQESGEMGWGQEELNEEIPSCPQWSTPATHLLDTCRLPQEYSDAPKTQAKLHSARKEVKDLVAGIE